MAVVYGNTRLTYKELNIRANRLAHYLVEEHKVGPESLVILCLDRSEHMIISMLAILKAGGAYVPIDPAYPDDRIEYIAEDTKSKIILTNEHYKERMNLCITKGVTESPAAIFALEEI